MATGLASDFKVYNDQVRGAFIERLTQASAFFNANSGGSVLMTTLSRRGDYAYESFITSVANLITRRDTTSVSDATALKLAMEEFISVKLNRKIGPLDQTLDSFRKVQMRADGPEALSFMIGTQVAKAVEVEMLNTCLRAARAAIGAQATNVYEVPSSGTITTAALNSGLAKFGDAYNRVVAWVMHSKVFFDLVGYQISASTHGDNIAGVVVQGGSPATFGRPVIITDSSSLVIDESASSVSTPDNVYHTLGLTAGAVGAESSEEEHIVYSEVSGKENLIARLQGEYAYNLGVKGCQWKVASGANPTDTAVGTGSNWTKVVTDIKDLGGIVVRSR